MKKILVALAMSVGLYAGGSLVVDIEPTTYIEEEVAPTPSPFYAGVGFGIDNENTRLYNSANGKEYVEFNEGYSNVSLFAGATLITEGTFGLAAEGRAAWTLDDYGVDSWGVFLKPEIEMVQGVTVFGLLGYQAITPVDFEYDALGVGAGLMYVFNDNIGAQVDYVYSVIEEDEFGFIPGYENLTMSLFYRF